MMSASEIPDAKILGQYFTPNSIANLMAKWVCSNNPKTILDPGVGHCALLIPCHKYCPNSKLIGYDIDQRISDYIKENVSIPASIEIRDYLKSWGGKYDGIICNPPYNKFQTIIDREILIEEFKNKIGIRLSGYTNILGYFLVKSIFELKSKGRCAYIVPYEFLNTGYGEVLKQYLIDKKVLRAILKFDNKETIFDDVITTSCILLIENNNVETTSFININNEMLVNNIDFDKLEQYGIQRNISELNSKEKWLKYFDEGHDIDYSKLITLSSIGKVKRGIATGDNNYFSLNKKMIDEFQISNECLIPCICKAPDIKTLIFTQIHFISLAKENKKMFLFDGCKAKTKADCEYIEFGEKKGTSKKYLTSHRRPWYLIENKKPAPILIAVFNRDKIKIIKNEAMVHNLTTFHGFHLHDEYDNDDFCKYIFCYLCSNFAKKLLYKNKREYGDSLDKFEPNDLNNALIFNPVCVSKNDKGEINKAFDKYHGDWNEKEFIDEINRIFKKYDELYS